MPINHAQLKADVLAKALLFPQVQAAWDAGAMNTLADAWNVSPRAGVSVASERDAVDVVIEAIAPDLATDVSAIADLACQRAQLRASLLWLLLQGDPRRPRTQAALFAHITPAQQAAITARLTRPGSWGEDLFGAGTVITTEDMTIARSL